MCSNAKKCMSTPPRFLGIYTPLLLGTLLRCMSNLLTCNAAVSSSSRFRLLSLLPVSTRLPLSFPLRNVLVARCGFFFYFGLPQACEILGFRLD